MNCPTCNTPGRKHGKTRTGEQRFKCRECGRTYSEPREYLFGEMRISEEKGLMALHLLCEGSSVRSVSRVTGLHKNTILGLLVWAGEKCEAFLERTVQDVPVEDVQIDELWGFVSKKEKTKKRHGDDDPQTGDAWCFAAIERTSKLVLAWHLGQRTTQHVDAFVEKVDRATEGEFQISSDGLPGYPGSVNYHLGTRADHGVLVKHYGTSQEGEKRYSPAKLTGIEKITASGNPDYDRICTSHVERLNLTLRMGIRRLTRLTNAFSKCWRNHKAALALYFAWYNFVKMHKTIKMTPAMKADLARKPWTMRELIAATVTD